MNWVDYIILLAIAWGALAGYSRGLVPVMLSLSGVILAAIVATVSARRVAEFADKQWQVRVRLTDWLYQRLDIAPTAELVIDDSTQKVASFSETITDFASQTVITRVADSLVPNVVEIIVLGAAFLVTFVIVRSLVKLIERILDHAIGTVVGEGGSRLLGMVAGATQSAIIAGIIVVLLYTLTVVPPMAGAAPWLKQSYLTGVALQLADVAWPYIARTLQT